MSTYIYLECLDHDPPLSSDGEVGQHLYDLPDIRKMIEQRDFYCELMKRDLPVSFDHHFTSNGARFLAQHHSLQHRYPRRVQQAASATS